MFDTNALDLKKTDSYELRIVFDGQKPAGFNKILREAFDALKLSDLIYFGERTLNSEKIYAILKSNQESATWIQDWVQFEKDFKKIIIAINELLKDWGNLNKVSEVIYLGNRVFLLSVKNNGEVTNE